MTRRRPRDLSRRPSTPFLALLGVLLLCALLLPRGSHSQDDEERRAGEAREPAGEMSEEVRRLPDTLAVRFGDGRSELRVPISKRDGGAFLRVGDFGRICGDGFIWDPDTYRGRVDVDTLSLSFLLDSPLFWTQAEIVQLEHATRYEDDQLWLPLDALTKVLVPVLGERMIWDAKRAELYVAAPRPWLENLSLDRGGRTFEMGLRPLPAGAYRLVWDPLGELVVEVRGLHLPPGQTQPNFRDRGIQGVRLEPRPGGLAVRVAVDPGWVGASLEERDGELHVEMTQVLADVQRGVADLLTTFLEPTPGDPSWGSRVVIEVSPTGSGGSVENRYLEDLASEVANLLEDTYHHQVVFLPDRREPGRQRGPSGIPEMPAVPDADLWIGLRMEQYASSAATDFLFVIPGQAPRYEAVGEQVPGTGAPIASTGGEQVLSPPPMDGRATEAAYRMTPWGQSPRFRQEASARLATEMARQLESDLQFRPARVLARPARIFRGLVMPAVLVYPAVSADAQGVRALSAPDQVTLVAGALARGIDLFLREQETRR